MEGLHDVCDRGAEEGAKRGGSRGCRSQMRCRGRRQAHTRVTCSAFRQAPGFWTARVCPRPRHSPPWACAAIDPRECGRRLGSAEAVLPASLGRRPEGRCDPSPQVGALVALSRRALTTLQLRRPLFLPRSSHAPAASLSSTSS
jgi:hypothetical protein